jgi:lipoprotein NlpI
MEPQSTMALNNIGTALMMKVQYDEAILLFNKVIALDPTNELAKVNLAWGLDEKNKQGFTSH